MHLNNPSGKLKANLIYRTPNAFATDVEIDGDATVQNDQLNRPFDQMPSGRERASNSFQFILEWIFHVAI